LTAVRQAAALAEIVYAQSDGKPLGETDLHRDAIYDLIFALQRRYRDDPSVYVSGSRSGPNLVKVCPLPIP
jgi:hypothetical protein